MNYYTNLTAACLLAALFIAINTATLNESRAQSIRTVALTSQQVAGAGNNIEFTIFDASPALNSNDEVVFGGFFAGPGVGNADNNGIFRENAGLGLGMVARASELAQGAGPGAFYESFDPPLINKIGDAAFHAKLVGPGVTGISDTGIFREGTGGGVNLVARKGNTAPTAAINVDYLGFNQLKFIHTGQTAFVADLAGPAVNDMNDSGIFREFALGPGVGNVVRAGDPAFGTGPGVFYSEFSELIFKESGIIAFMAELVGPNVTSTNDQAIYRETGSGTIDLVARSGNIAPIGSGVTYESLLAPVVNENGQTAFNTVLTGVGVNGTNNQAVMREAVGGSVAMMYRSGNPAPGAAAGVNFLFFGNPLINDAGKLAFAAGLTGTDVDPTNAMAIFREPPTGSLEMVARTGAPAPGTDAIFAGFSRPLFNAAGQIAFAALLEGPGVDASENEGIFVQDQNGQLKLLVREGDTFDVSDDPSMPDMRTVADGSFGDLQNGLVTLNGFNDMGGLVFFAAFDDGSEGVFVGNANIILGDLNFDGLVNLLDVAPFVDAIGSGDFIAEADVNQDGVLNLLDVQPFIDLLGGG